MGTMIKKTIFSFENFMKESDKFNNTSEGEGMFGGPEPHKSGGRKDVKTLGKIRMVADSNDPATAKILEKLWNIAQPDMKKQMLKDAGGFSDKYVDMKYSDLTGQIQNGLYSCTEVLSMDTKTGKLFTE